MSEFQGRCSRHFLYSDLLCCTSTQKQGTVENIPQQQQTWQAIADLASNILDPVVDQFGSIELTYGFCGHKLGLAFLKNAQPRIAPGLDQHAGYECNSKGKRICDRGGMACDFRVPDIKSSVVAAWLVQHCAFDRFYYYGEDRPVHVSYAPELSYYICWLTENAVGRRQPRRYTVKGFLQQLSGYEP